jgi:hypothetical protein
LPRMGKGGMGQSASTRRAHAAILACVLSLGGLALAAPVAEAITSQQLANQAMRIDPRKPGDINLFTSKFVNGANGLYPSGSAMQPSSAPDLTQAQARSRLKSYLEKQFPNDPAKVNAGLAQFDSQQTRQLIPDPTLRTAFVGMRGTLLQPTISHYLNSGRFLPPIKYGPIPQQDLIAVTAGQSGQRQIIFNDRYSREDFRQLIGIMGHEIQHDDTSAARAEEAILNGLSGMTQLQVLKKHPGLAYTRTELSRQMNTLALLFLNSRENDSPNSEIYAPTGVGVAPGSPFNTHDFWTIFGGDSQTSPAPSVFGQIATSLGLPSASSFSLATAKTFQNLNDTWLSDVGRAQISVLLKMRSVTEIANRSGLSRSEVIDKLQLQPYLDSQN